MLLTQLEPQTTEKLQDLVQMNSDCSVGFQTAAEVIEQEDLIALFRELARRRSRFSQEVKRLIKGNRCEYADSWSGKFYPWWLDLRGRVNAGDPYVILIEAQRGEAVIKAYYEEMVGEVTGTPVHKILSRQYRQIQDDHDRIRGFTETARRTRES